MTGCWIWTALLNEHGYGLLYVSGDRNRLAHRVSWEMHKGPIPDGHGVLHRCDTPACVNPDHLFTGTQKDNLSDCSNKNRNAFGARHKGAKLNDEQVIDIRTKRISQSQFAKLYGVSFQHISGIQRGKYWPKVSVHG